MTHTSEKVASGSSLGTPFGPLWDDFEDQFFFWTSSTAFAEFCTRPTYGNGETKLT